MSLRHSVGIVSIAVMSCNEPKAKVASAPSETPAPASETPSTATVSSPATEHSMDTSGGAGVLTDAPVDNAVAVYDSLPSCTGEYERTLKLHSWTQPQLQARFGPPTKKEAYRVVERQGEFYGLVEEIYPTTDPKNLDVPIEEWTWRKGDCLLTVWFHRTDGTWRALGDVLYHYADEF